MSEEASPAEPATAGSWLRAQWHRVALSLVVLFMLWKRFIPYDSFVREEAVFFSGNDAYYHFREVGYVVRHWPQTMPFDPWTRFPTGTATGQFGTLWDQAIATAALLIGLGSPTDRLVAEVTVAAPAVAGALLALPVYGIARQVADRRAALVAAVLLALFPGTVLRRSLAGFADHHVAEMILQATAVFALLVALRVADREQPVFEQVRDGDWQGLRTPTLWAVVAGLAIAVYLWTWPPGVVLVGILGVFVAVAAALEFVRGGSVEQIVFVGAVSHVVVTIVMALSSPSLGSSSTQISLIHVLFPGLVAIECFGLGLLERNWDRFDLDRELYPVAVGTAVILGVAVLWLVAPDVFKSVRSSALRAFGLTHTDQSRTIAEAQSPDFGHLGAFFYRQYGAAFITAAAGAVVVVAKAFDRAEGRSQRVLLVVWSAFLLLMALTQVRFNYYLAAAVAVLSGILVSVVLDWVDFPAYDDLADVEVYQVLSIVILAMVLLFPLTPVMSPQPGATVFNGAANSGPGAVTTWSEGLDWMEDGTPSPASSDLEYYGTYQQTDDFAYPESAYGVMSWWDYGHWITVEGERIPVANPFQQNPRPASAFFQARTERRSNAILDALPVTSDVDDRTTNELEAIGANRTRQQAGEDIRYVMIDDQMAGGKFSAITRWAGPGTQDYFGRTRYEFAGQNRTVFSTTDRYDEAMLSKLYYEDATELQHYRLVHEVDRYAIISGYAQVRPGTNRLAQRPRRSFSLRGGWNRSGQSSPKNVSRTVERAQGQPINFGPSTYLYDAEVESRVKTFERVRGATITGQAEPDTTVQAILPLQVTNTGRQFTYLDSTQTDEDGNFQLTVPYPSRAELGPAEGGTNETVTATGRWQVFTGSLFGPQTLANTTVTERQVIEGDTVEVELSPVNEDTQAAPNGTDSDGPTATPSGGDSGSEGDIDGGTTPTPTPTATETSG
jgi:oligosaccharyl transferase (archaeosortase A-associated)